ncbi:MAG: kinase [Thaumarchaeota archaeon]|nr:kinase [Nitrososphaerota archaeon]
MIISKTPIRISLGAGGTDLPGFYSKFGARFATSSGSKFTYVIVNQHPEKIVWMGMNKAERVDTPEELQHNIVGKVLALLDIRKNVEIVSMSDVLPNSGLGTSSSFVVGLLNALHSYKGEYLWPQEIAEEACYIEQELLSEQTGKQDQYAAALGGIIWLEIGRDGKVSSSRMKLKSEFVNELNDHLVFFYTGIQRSSTAVHTWHSHGKTDETTLGYLKNIQEVAIEIKGALEKQDIMNFGRLLDSHWQFKKQMANGISNDLIDDVYQRAIGAGAIGGNLMGAGGGGHFIFACPDSSSKIRVRKELIQAGLQPVDMRFEMQGSTVTNMS